MSQNNLSKVKLTSKEEDYSQWYLDIAKAGELFEYSPTPGCITFLPKAVSIWENIKAEISKRLKQLGVEDIYLPLLIPYSFLEKEKDHVEGFSPEFAIVTHGGGKELEEKLVIRPTSETLFCDFFKNRLQSYRDLPMLYNQWVNVMRWEKRTRPFLRTAEFYWQEGHTLHETLQDAEHFAFKIAHNVYIEVIREFLAIDGIAGEKTPSERFAGAERTYTFEPMMSNGWALQICTTHILSQAFMRGFDVSFIGRDGKEASPFYTSWGISTRSIGGIISSHSDNKGLILPPKISPYSAVILPIYGKDNATLVNDYAIKIAKAVTMSDTVVPVRGEYFKAML